MSNVKKLLRFSVLLCILSYGWACNLESKEKSIAFISVSTKEQLENVKQEAKEAGLPLLVVFFGSGWCPWSEKMAREVFSHQGFKESMEGECLTVKIELPAKESADPSFAELKSLAAEYDVKESPTLVLLSAEGEFIAKEGYFLLQAEGFAKHFKESFHGFKEIKEKLQSSQVSLSESLLQQLHQKARDFGFHRLQEEIVNLGTKIAKEPFFFLEKYESLSKERKKKDLEVQALRKKILSLDPKNVKKTHLRLAMIDFTNRIDHKKSKKEPKSVVEPLISYIKQFGKNDEENLWKIEMMVAQYFFSKKEIASAIKHAERSLEAAPEQVKSDVMQTLIYLTSNHCLIRQSAKK